MRIDLCFEPGTKGVAELPVVTVQVAEDSHSFATPNGTMWRLGYAALDDGGRFLRTGEHALGGGACLAFNVAGTSHRREAVQHPSFALGSPVRLRPKPNNPHDANAVGIWDGRGTIQAGFVPRALSAQVAASFRGGLPLGGAVLSEYRLDSRSGERVGMQIVVAPASTLVLDVVQSADLAFTVSLDLADALVAAAAQFCVPLSDPERGLIEALRLLVEQPEALRFIAATVEGYDCTVLFDVQADDLGPPRQIRALLKPARQPNPAQHAALVQGGWRQQDIGAVSWSAEADLTDLGAVARIAGAALMTIFRVFGAAGVLMVGSDIPPEPFARMLGSRGVAVATGP